MRFVRHAQTGAAERDEDRHVSLEGKERAREHLRSYSFRPDLVISTTALYGIETAMIIAPGEELITISELYFPTDPEQKATLDRVSAVLGNAPLLSYLENSETQPILSGYARMAGDRIRRLLAETGSEQTLIIGHAILVMAVGLEFCRDDSNALWLLREQLEESEGFHIPTDGRLRPLKFA